MFKIADGRDYFYQWDIDRKLIVSDPSVTEVHFCNRTGACSLVVKTYELDGNWVADVPNVLLQDTWPIKTFAYCGDNYTKVEQVYTIKPRSKPSDYVYTETDVLNYDSFDKRLKELETAFSNVKCAEGGKY